MSTAPDLASPTASPHRGEPDDPRRWDDYLERILTSPVYDVAIETPLERAPRLSTRLGDELWLKREDLQPVFSFKIRGAYHKIAGLDPEVRARGVVAASAGNHAQGVALAARRFGCRAVIVMPAGTPRIKHEAVSALGGEVVLSGDTFHEASARARDLAAAEGLAFIHPYDDPDVIAGQGTIGMEIFRQHRDPIDAIFVCVGGGGLAAGIGVYVKRLYPHVRVIGVEPVDAASMHAALAAGAPVDLPDVGRFADGVAVKRVGDETFRLCREVVDEMVLVDNDEICAAIKDVFEDTRSILEPAGALAVAGAKAWVAREGAAGRCLVAIASGANMNFDRLRFVAERAEIGEHREAQLAVTIPERPGAFLTLCTGIGDRNVTEFNYRRADAERAHVFVGVAVADRGESRALCDQLTGAGFGVVDLSDHELAKNHLKHLVGGRNPEVRHERILRFSFPERPGALRRFLEHLSPHFDISLFHYRNQGGDVGRVLTGIVVEPGREADFAAFLAALDYPYVDDTDDPACRLFL
ncbi:MAG: threonine ammonia-lyase, biosynthetic [Kofleriaceae bacterium]|nr:threonine ammonia-lyase, biosynthetic [Myxococcales bacterium]MCB9565441.1 threonine ammonia-lyase, biosynthetic [Kofleriaceae bacterium]